MGKKFKLSRTNQYYHHFLVGFFVFMVSFVVSGLVSSVFTPVGETSAQTISVENRATGYYVAVTSPDSVSLDVTPTPSGKSVVSTANVVNVKTNAPLGYKLYLSTEDDELKSSNTDISQTFTPVTSSSLSVNTWGFSKTGTDNSWLAVPEVTSGKESSGYLLSSATAPNTPNGDNISVYYGVNSDTSMPSGTYTTTVTYTAIGDGIPEEHTMQEFTMSECINMPVDQTFYLIDSRNNKIYSIIHAKDGNCWMTQNLALDGNRELTPTDSNVTTAITLPANITDGTASNNNVMQLIANLEGYDGTLYNWCAATLNDTSCKTMDEATQDICPKGWKLPSSAGTLSYANLFSYYGLPSSNVSGNYTSIVEDNPLYFTRAGYYFKSGSDYNGYTNQGRSGNYWTSTPSSTTSTLAYRFTYNSTVFNPQYDERGGKSGAWSVRCVFAPSMQEFSAADCAKISADTQFVLTDTRNYKQYKIVKARDNNCWMADNLKLYSTNNNTITLTTSDSDITSGTFNVPISSNWSGNQYTSALLHVADGTGDVADKTSEYDGEVYFNWCTALAKTSCAESSGTINQSICPKGWRLPINGDTTQDKTYAKLMDTYSITSGPQLLDSSNPAYILGFHKYYGDWDWGRVSENRQGTDGRFWSSTALSEVNAYLLYYSSSSITPSGIDNKGNGFSIRCVLR